MKKTCKIRVESTRNLTFVPHSLPEFDEIEEEEWEEAPHRDENRTPCPPAPEPSVLHAVGLWEEAEDGSLRISYEDSEITGLEGCLTTFCLSREGTLILLRRGPVRTCMVFDKGARHLCDYGAEHPLGSVVLHTHSLKQTVSENACEFYVEYSLEICGTTVEKNRLTVEAEMQ